MKRIGLYLAAVPHGGGAFQYSMAMLTAVASLPKDRYEVLVVYCHSGWRDLVESVAPSSVFAPVSKGSYLSAYLWRKIGLPVAAWQQLCIHIDSHSRLLMAQDRDLWIYPAQDPMAYMLPANALGTVHDLMHRYEPQFPEVSGFRLREYHYKAISQYCRGVLVDSDLGKQQLIASYGTLPGKVWPLTYVPPSYMFDTVVPDGFSQRYRLPAKFLFYPAQFWAHKNHLALLRAARSVIGACPDLQLVFVGSRKNGYQNFLAEVQRLGMNDRVHVLDYVDNRDMPELYRRARALVMPTFFGPTNIPPLEAMVVGCPIGVSGIYGMREQCQDAALYFDPKSVDDIANVLSDLWTNDELCAELSRRGRIRATLFTQDKFNQTVMAILDRMDG